MQLSLTLLAGAFILSSAAAKLVEIPTNVTLIHPVGKVNKNAEVKIGFSTEPPAVLGLSRNITASLTYPNGTTANGPTSFMDPGKCSTPESGSAIVAGKFWVNDTGSYTASWNYTFITSADPSQANDTFCGPGPFSYESIIVKSTFEVADLGKGVVNPEKTLSSQLPTVPTAKALAPDAKSGASTLRDLGMFLLGSTAFMAFVTV